MALSGKNRLLPTMIAVASLLGMGVPLASGQSPAQPGSGTWEKLEGKWCDVERGCTHWWSTYHVVVWYDNSIRIYYGSQEYHQRSIGLFSGKIREPLGKWTITVTDPKQPDGKPIELTVLSLGTAKQTVKGKVTGAVEAKLKARVSFVPGVQIDGDAAASAERKDAVPGGRKDVPPAGAKDAVPGGGKDVAPDESKRGSDVQWTIPIVISDATIEGGTKLGADLDEEEVSGKREFEGKVTVKIPLSEGIGALKGTFKGTFKGQIESSIIGLYVVPPARCSESGRPLSKEEKADIEERAEAQRKELTANKGGEQHRGRQRDAKIESIPGRYRSGEEKRAKEDNLEKAKHAPAAPKALQVPIEVELGRARAPRPEPQVWGKFVRKVTGTVSGIEPYTITLELPPLPILDHKCSVIDELPKRTLKLVKQHDATR